jgi:anti-anti-sigma factor
MTEETEGESQEFHLRETQGILVVTFLDARLALQEPEALYRLVESEGRRKLVLNFANVHFLTSVSLAVLLTLKKRSAAIKGAIRFCRLNAEMLETLEITRMARPSEIFDTEQEAINSF